MEECWNSLQGNWQYLRGALEENEWTSERVGRGLEIVGPGAAGSALGMERKVAYFAKHKGLKWRQIAMVGRV